MQCETQKVDLLKEKKDEKNCVRTLVLSGVGFGALDALGETAV